MARLRELLGNRDKDIRVQKVQYEDLSQDQEHHRHTIDSLSETLTNTENTIKSTSIKQQGVGS